MTDAVGRRAERTPSAEALWTPEGTWSYDALDAAVRRTANIFRERGLEAGTRVALRHHRSPELIILLWALWRTGAVATPLSTRLPPPKIFDRMRQVGACHLITEEQLPAEEVRESIAVWSPERLTRGVETTQVDAGADGEPPDERPATIVYTSGTTGTPKAVRHTWRNHVYSAKGANANIPIRRGDRWLLSLPLYHVGGLAILVRCALAGGSVAVPGLETGVGEGLQTSAATHVSLVATQLRRLLEEDVRTPNTLRAVLLGGGPLPTPLLEQAVKDGWPIHTTYGCTEMASQVTTTPPGAPLDDLRTAGRCLPHRRVRITDGEIEVAGAPLFDGYVTTEGLVDPRTEDGWYATGDRGRIDASRRLHVLGRVDRMFVSGGENIQPEEIESALVRLEGVVRAVVVPVPDETYGKRPVAFVDVRDRGTDSELSDALADALPRFKIPEAFYSLPMHAGEKRAEIDREHLTNRARMLQHGKNPGR